MTYRMASALGAAPDLSQWWVKNGFWSKWAGLPPCRSGAVLTGADCQYQGVYADQVPPPPSPSGLAVGKRLDLWLEERCAAGDYVALNAPHVNPMLNREIIEIFAGPGVPGGVDEPLDLRPSPSSPKLVTYGCQAQPGGDCPDGMVALPGGGCQMATPPPSTAEPGAGTGTKAVLAVGALAFVGGLFLYDRRRRR